MKEFEASRIRVDPDSGRVVIDDESLSWFQGVLGERRVADRLDHLGDEFTVLHSVPFRKREGDIDHIVVSSSGVTIINTKHSPGRPVWSAGYGIYVGGQERKGFIVNLAESVREAERRLSAVVGMAVPVRGVLCFVDPSGITRKAAAGGDEFDVPIEVVSDLELVGALHRSPELNDAQVEQIVAAAVLPGTWHDSPRPSTVGAHIAREFDALESAIGADVARRLAEQAAVREAERITAKAARRPTRTTAARPPARKPTSTTTHMRTMLPPARVGNRMRAPGSQGLAALALWPMLVSLLIAISSITGLLVGRGLIDTSVFDALTLGWLVVFVAPILFAWTDRLRLRRRGVLRNQTLLPWILLGPLAYLIARSAAVRAAGFGAGPVIVAHLVAGIVGTVLVLGLVTIASFMLA